MKYRPIAKDLFIKNREKLNRLLPSNAVAVLNSNDILPKNGDGVLPFYQNSDLFYLSGADQEETILVIAPNHPDKSLREVLFVRETNDLIATWEGHKLTKAEAQEITGIKTIEWTNNFDSIFHTIMVESSKVYLDSNEHLRAATKTETRSDRFLKWCKDKYPLHEFGRLAPMMESLRSLKEKEEIKTMQHACDITERAFRHVLEVIKPGVWEYEIEAEFNYEFLKNRSRGFAYDPIIASGASACVLHYIQNNQQCKDGDLLLMDVGAEYANYNADMTRTIPVNGRFTKRQRAVYDAVLHVKSKATEMLRPGITLKKYQKEVVKIMEGELISLGLFDKTDIKKQDPNNPLYKKYFMHGTSHFIGLDVHDVGNFNKGIEAGMAFTVEPGIYIREENIGIRLEDNIIVTDKGHINLMKNIPIHAEEIEHLMNQSS